MNVKLSPLALTNWRKIALGSWNSGGDPSVYGVLELNASKIFERQRSSQPGRARKSPTLTVLVARAAALTLKRYPQMNGLIRFGRIYLRKNVSIFLQTAVDDDGKELSGLVIEDADVKSLDQMMAEIAWKASAIREDRDPNFKRAKASFSLVPVVFTRWLLNMTSFLMYTLNLDLSSLGLPRDPFGSVMITSIGSIGLDEAFAPLVPYSRVPMLLAVGAVKERPVVDNGIIKPAPLFKICVTFDHRFMDGVYAAKMAKEMQRLLESDAGLDELGLQKGTA